jgi:hypothetical protein
MISEISQRVCYSYGWSYDWSFACDVVFYGNDKFDMNYCELSCSSDCCGSDDLWVY